MVKGLYSISVLCTVWRTKICVDRRTWKGGRIKETIVEMIKQSECDLLPRFRGMGRAKARAHAVFSWTLVSVHPKTSHRLRYLLRFLGKLRKTIWSLQYICRARIWKWLTEEAGPAWDLNRKNEQFTLLQTCHNGRLRLCGPAVGQRSPRGASRHWDRPVRLEW